MITPLTLSLALSVVAAQSGPPPQAPAPRPVELSATDGQPVTGTFFDTGDIDLPVVLLFHQAGSGNGEYATIGPRLVELGFNALAIDQRSGGSLFGENPIAKRQKGKVSYLDARPDLEGALAWARRQGYETVFIWGSSYSSALAFLVAADHPEVKAVLAFSPGEYLGKKGAVAKAARRVTAPVLILTPPREKKRARPIANAVKGKVTFATPKGAVHGSSMLIPARCEAAANIWPMVEKFLDEAVKASGDGPIVLGSLDKLVIRQIVRQRMADARACYEPEAKKDARLEGKVVVKFIIVGDGSVKEAKIHESSLSNGTVEACLAKAVSTWTFPRPKGGGIVIVNYPFVFRTAPAR